MKKMLLIIPAVILVIALAVTLFFLFNRQDPHQEELMLYLSFDEGKSLTVNDSSGNLPQVEMSYNLSGGVYTEAQDPQWRESGISGGCLLFDGSTYITYNKNQVAIQGSSLTVSVWIAPRTFEWDDPNAAENGTDNLTAIIGQSSKSENAGFLLGYERFGRLSFQVGTGDEWLSIWSNGDNLSKYEWNYVAATFDGEAGEMCLYLNGQKVASRSLPDGARISLARNKSLIVGRNGQSERLGAGFLNAISGYLDELKVYSCALTSEEIRKVYESTDVPEIEFSEIWLQNLLTDDYTKAQFHASPLQFWMNEPHAPVYYNGMYHLFFQENMSGSYWRNICWGHWVSEDMVNWTQVKEAITPTENSVVPDGVWSGGATLDANGVPLLFFTAGNDDYGSYGGLISNQNIGVAYPADLSDPNLTEWVIYDELAVVQKGGQGRTGEFRDSHIWKEGDKWCMLVCSGSSSSSGGTALLYTTDKLELLSDGTIDMNWQYVGPVYEMENQPTIYGQTWELPVMLPISNEAGTITKYLFIISPAPAGVADNKIYYFLGSFDSETGTFTPDEAFADAPHLLDYGANVFTGPSGFIDPVSGDAILFSIMQDQRSAAEQGTSGWAHTCGLARKIWLTDDGSDVRMAPIEALTSLEEEVLVEASDLTLEAANALLSNVSGDMLHITLVADIQNAASFGINVKTGNETDLTSFTYNTGKDTIQGYTMNRGKEASTNTVSGSLPTQDGKITMDIYIDRSLVEAFFNESKSISMRAYVNDPASQGVQLFADGNVTIEHLHVATMGSIFQ